MISLKDFKDSDVLFLKLTPYTDEYVVPNWEPSAHDPTKTGSPTVLGLATAGPYEVETTGRSLRDVLLDLEPDDDAWNSAVRRHKKAEERFRVRLTNDSAFNKMSPSEQETHIDETVFVWSLQHSAARLFFEGEGRGRLPMKSVEIVENRGPRHDDFKSQVDDDRDFRKVQMENMRLQNLKMQAEIDAAAAPVAKVKKTTK